MWMNERDTVLFVAVLHPPDLVHKESEDSVVLQEQLRNSDIPSAGEHIHILDEQGQ